MSTGPMLPKNVRQALHLEVKRLVDEQGVTQTEIARRSGVSQPAIAKLYNRPEVGTETAQKFLDAFKVTREDLLTRHRMRDPAPETDMLVREFIDWLEGSPAIKAVARRPDVTVKDLLRVKKTPPRRGEADSDEVYSHLLQLRVGEIAGVPAEERSASTAEAEMRRRHGRKPK